MTESVLALDGPAASGKSSTALAVARRLGCLHLDSGAIYRAVTFVALDEALGDDAEAMLRAVERRGFTLQPFDAGFEAFLDGEPAEARIRTPAVTAHVSRISALPAVREWVNQRLRLAAHGRAVVVDGRDIGTVVFPEARLKVYLHATARARAERRLRQRGDAVDAAALEAETARLAERDHQDSTRAVAPLRRAPDAAFLDTSELTFEEGVERVIALWEGRLAEGGAEG
ncbi:MAG: (d)CMP kinase [Gemmatimonadales bacterium]|nr:(d)CMP kinase [Gemmatimonadales bacterium]